MLEIVDTKDCLKKKKYCFVNIEDDCYKPGGCAELIGYPGWIDLSDINQYVVNDTITFLCRFHLQ